MASTAAVPQWCCGIVSVAAWLRPQWRGAGAGAAVCVIARDPAARHGCRSRRRGGSASGPCKPQSGRPLTSSPRTPVARALVRCQLALTPCWLVACVWCLVAFAFAGVCVFVRLVCLRGRAAAWRPRPHGWWCLAVAVAAICIVMLASVTVLMAVCRAV